MRSGLFITMLKTSSEAGVLIGKAARKSIGAAGDFGASVARGAGVSEGVGRTLGYGALAAGAYTGAKAVDQKRQELLYKAGYYG